MGVMGVREQRPSEQTRGDLQALLSLVGECRWLGRTAFVCTIIYRAFAALVMRGYTDSLTCVYHACHRYLLISYESDRTFATTWSSVRRTNAVQTTKGVSLERRARKR